MDEFNPYAPPRTEIALDPLAPIESGAWRDGRLLVMTRDFTLPDRCLKCNLPADGFTLKRKLSWHPWYWYLLVLINVPVYIIAALIVRKTARVEFPLCEEHRRRRRRALFVGWLLCLSSIPALIVGLSLLGESLAGLVVAAFVALFLTGLIYGVVGSQLAVAKRIDARFVRLKNVTPAFLAELPAWPS